jgi:general secretion pathway protein C
VNASATLPRITQSRWLPGFLIALAVLWMALRLVQLLWTWLAPPMEIIAPETGAVVRAVAGDELSLAQFHLFGQPNSSPSGAYAGAPDTTLKLTLKGTNSHNDPLLATAIIASDDSTEKVYKVGDEFPNRVRVEAIYPDRVVLNAAGRVEILRLLLTQRGAEAIGEARAAAMSNPAQTSGGLIGLNNMAPAAPAFVNPNVVAAPPIDWEAVRQAAIADPNTMAKAFSVLPVMIDNKLAGVRVSSNQYGAQLAEAGLGVEDIVTAVNGRRLDSVAAGLAALESLKTAGAVTLTVNRNGEEKTLPAIRMPQ